jgi:phosphatidyl-myo-inositol dimannoside synthase
VVAPTREGCNEVDQNLPYQVVRYPKSYIRSTRSAFNWLAEVTENLGPDAVHFATALPVGRLGPRLRERTGLPYTVVAHGTGDLLLPARFPFARRALRRVLSRADLVYCNSEFTAGEVDRISRGRSRTWLLQPTVDLERFSLEVSGAEVRDEHSLGGRFVVFFVSRLVKRKGADTLLRAVARADDVVAVVGGAGPERDSLERLARELELGDRAIFTGEIPDERLPSYYAAADAFCMPFGARYGGLDTEGFGVVYLEAQASGLPCVAGRHGGSAEAVEDEVTGFVLQDPSPDSVAEALVTLRDDPALCAMFGGAGRERVERHFSPRTMAGRLEEGLESAMGGSLEGFGGGLEGNGGSLEADAEQRDLD